MCNAPVAQRIRALGYGPRCRGFESLRACNRFSGVQRVGSPEMRCYFVTRLARRYIPT